MTRRGICAVLVATAAVAAGCGGGDDEAEALPKAEFVERGNAICERFATQIGRLAEENFTDVQSEDDLTPEIAGEFIDGAVPRFEEALDGLDALGAPEGDEDEVDEFIQAGRDEAEEIGSASREESLELITSDSPTPEFDRLSSEYGLDACDDS